MTEQPRRGLREIHARVESDYWFYVRACASHQFPTGAAGGDTAYGALIAAMFILGKTWPDFVADVIAEQRERATEHARLLAQKRELIQRHDAARAEAAKRRAEIAAAEAVIDAWDGNGSFDAQVARRNEHEENKRRVESEIAALFKECPDDDYSLQASINRLQVYFPIDDPASVGVAAVEAGE